MTRVMTEAVPTGNLEAYGSGDLFAGIPVSSFPAALRWYQQLFGSPPSFFPGDLEAVWQVAEHRFVFIEHCPERAGYARHLVFVGDLERLVGHITDRGLASAEDIGYSNGVRKVAYRDPDGNEFGFGGQAPVGDRS